MKTNEVKQPELAQLTQRWLVILVFALGASAIGTAMGWSIIMMRGPSAPEPLTEPLPPPGAFDWPQWRGPDRDGRSREHGILTDWPENGPPKLWEQAAGPGFSSVVVARDRVLTLTKTTDGEAVICWDADSGRELWRYSYPCKYNIGFGSGPRSTPTVAGDFVYTVGATGLLHCLELAPPTSAGKVVWHQDLAKMFKAHNTQYGVTFSPLVEGDLLVMVPGGPNQSCAAAFDKNSGEPRWHNLNDHPGYSSPTFATIAGRRQVVLFTGAAIVGLEPATGQELWRFPWDKTLDHCNIATPIVHDDHVFISASYDQGCALLKIEPDGDHFKPRLVYKNSKMRNHFSTSVLHEGRLFGFSDSILTCMDFKTGKVLWKENGLGKGSLLIADGQLIVLSEQGNLVVAPASAEGFTPTANFPVFSTTCWTVPVLSNGRLYVRNEQKLVCFDLRKR